MTHLEFRNWQLEVVEGIDFHLAECLVARLVAMEIPDVPQVDCLVPRVYPPLVTEMEQHSYPRKQCLPGALQSGQYEAHAC